MSVGGILMSTGTASSKPREFKTNMDKDAFLNLLVVQLKNQNPLQPMEDKEFISQMAQFTNLETTQNMNRTVKINSAYNMVNKFAKAVYTDQYTSERKEVFGVVQSVKINNEKLTLVIQDKEVSYDDIREITDTLSEVDKMQMINDNFGQVYAFNLMGKTVKGTHNKEAFEGIVEKVKMDKGKIVLTVDGKDVAMSSISEIKE